MREGTVWTPGQIGQREVKPVFRLTESDLQSATWKKLVAYYDDQLRIRRERLEGRMDVAETERIRGQISEIKDLLKLNTMKPQQDAHDSTNG